MPVTMLTVVFLCVVGAGESYRLNAAKQERVLTLFSTEPLASVEPELEPIQRNFEMKDPAKKLFGVLHKGRQFSIFNEEHAKEAAHVYDYLLSRPTFEEFCKHALALRYVLNEGLYVYAVSTALLHRRDTEGAVLPPLWEIIPHSFLPGLARVLESGSSHSNGTPGSFVTGTSRDPEHRLAWWREDVRLNAHHYQWHQTYPYMGVRDLPFSPRRTKDRQGELFYYVHHQMLARYDAERLAVGLMRVESYSDWHLPIPEGYDSHLTDYSAKCPFSARPSGMVPADMVHRVDTRVIRVSDMSYYADRLLDAVNTGKFQGDKSANPEDLEVTVDRLGDAVEASISSPNSRLYGNVHNDGHLLIAGITDPDSRYLSPLGVMSETATACRDPMFYRWHKFIDNLFNRHKTTLEPYSENELKFDGVTVESLKVHTPTAKGQAGSEGCDDQVLTTFMEQLDVDVKHDMFKVGLLDVPPNTKASVTVQQLNHDDFEYRIGVTAEHDVNATFRIYMAPSRDAQGETFCLDEQRRLFIEMDKFAKPLRAGSHNITRWSNLSSVIKPRAHDKSFDELIKLVSEPVPNEAGWVPTDGSRTCSRDRYLQCGWPQGLLLPRGTAIGMKFDLFVMVTNWDDDRVPGSAGNLHRGTSYCGERDQMYPDKRAMGFPFDRQMKAYADVNKFAESFENMAHASITIKHDPILRTNNSTFDPNKRMNAKTHDTLMVKRLGRWGNH